VPVTVNTSRISSMPFKPISECASKLERVSILSWSLPLSKRMGLSFSMASLLRPRSLSSSFTFSMPIFSILSMAMVISVSLS
jgi:hypothetical protein